MMVDSNETVRLSVSAVWVLDDWRADVWDADDHDGPPVAEGRGATQGEAVWRAVSSLDVPWSVARGLLADVPPWD